MWTPSRRDILKLGAFGAGTLLLQRTSILHASNEIGSEPHFFLFVILNGGADPSYMFDARPLSMTKAGKIQNYLGKEPSPWVGTNGVSTLATSLVKPLERFRDRFSVLNGVHMAPSFDGHVQNMNYLFSGKPFGGDSFIPHLNHADTGRPPQSLDAVVPSDPVTANLDNHSAVVPLQTVSVDGLSAKLNEIEPPRPDDKLIRFIRNRLIANAADRGRFSTGSSLMLAGLDGAPQLHRQLAQLTVPDPTQPPERQSLALIAECFRLSICRSAIYVLPEYFDVHAPAQAKTQPKLFGDAVGRIANLFAALAETPFDDKRSMFDVTTVMVASEFGRTLRASGNMEKTGTHHNQFSSSILLAGKGIRAGLVIGASDLPDETAAVSKAHLGLDPTLEKAFGRPFDFATARPRDDLPNEFNVEDYLTIGSVVNTVYSLFGVPRSRYRTPRRDAAPAPILDILRA
jgi:hypothetical protein